MSSIPNPATTDWVPLQGARLGGMTYWGTYEATRTYYDGDCAIGTDGVLYMCVKDGTVGSAPVKWPGVGAPQGAKGDTGAQGIQGVGVPLPVVNGQWIKGVGGAAVWSAITAADVTGLVTADISWRVVGASGQPAFQNGWTTWDPTGGRDVRFRKLASGLVLLAGIAKAPASIVNPIFTLPVGYRLKASTTSGPTDLYFGSGVCNTAPCTYQIIENGTVNIIGGTVNQWCDLSGLSFLAEQ